MNEQKNAAAGDKAKASGPQGVAPAPDPDRAAGQGADGDANSGRSSGGEGSQANRADQSNDTNP